MRKQIRFTAMLLALLACAGLAPNAAAQTFAATGSLLTARDSHTATLLNNGKVLIVGGEDNGFSPLASAEVYDPATGTFSATGSMAHARLNHTATLLTSGKVLVTGGAGLTGTLATAELYDPATGLFTPAGVMARERFSHTATLLGNGKVLLAGGYGILGTLSSAEIYDPASSTFQLTTGNMTGARAFHTATLLPAGKVLLTGGLGATVQVATAELFDPATSTFAVTGSMSVARYSHTANLVAGKVIVAGGFNDPAVVGVAENFNPATGAFEPAVPMTQPRGAHVAATIGTNVLLAGGVGSGTLAAAELYDSATGSSAATGSMALARFMHTATTLANGKVLVAGGYNGLQAMASAELYSPATSLPPTVSFSAAPLTIQLGQNSTLTWDSSDATAVTINGGAVAVDGTLVVSPSTTTQYDLIATGPGGSASASVTVTVTMPPPTVTFTAGSLNILQGQSSTLTWDSTHATGASINGSSVPVDGSMTVSPSATTTYNLDVTGPGGSVSASLTVNVTMVVPLDVKPGDVNNVINSRSKGRIPAAILSSTTFNAPAAVNTSSLTFGPTGNEASLATCAAEDVNADGRADLMCHFDTQLAAFQPGDTTARLKGRTTANLAFQGTDTVRVQ